MNCKFCDYDNNEDARFCSGCGRLISLSSSLPGMANSHLSRYLDMPGLKAASDAKNSPALPPVRHDSSVNKLTPNADISVDIPADYNDEQLSDDNEYSDDEPYNNDPYDDEYDDEYYDEFDDDPYEGERDIKSRRVFTGLSVLIWLVAAAVIFASSYFINSVVLSHFGSWQGLADILTGKQEQIVATAAIESYGSGYESGHKLIVTANEGDKLLVLETNQTGSISDSTFEIDIYDSFWIPDDVLTDNPEIQVTLNIRVMPLSGEAYDISAPSFTVSIPKTPLKIINPALEASTTMAYSIEILSKPGARVNVGGYDVTYLMDEEGRIRHSHSFKQTGANKLTITASQLKHRKAEITLDVNVPMNPTPLLLDTRIPQRTSLDTVVISGISLPGAVITSDAAQEPEIIAEEGSGAFSFTARLKDGENTIEITAELKDMAINTQKVTVIKE
ncbi:MAG: hypothetical protein ACOYJD_05940 [Christensenellales bacterium]|jgi:hypothetical protein